MSQKIDMPYVGAESVWSKMSVDVNVLHNINDSTRCDERENSANF